MTYENGSTGRRWSRQCAAAMARRLLLRCGSQLLRGAVQRENDGHFATAASFASTAARLLALAQWLHRALHYELLTSAEWAQFEKELRSLKEALRRDYMWGRADLHRGLEWKAAALVMRMALVRWGDDAATFVKPLPPERRLKLDPHVLLAPHADTIVGSGLTLAEARADAAREIKEGSPGVSALRPQRCTPYYAVRVQVAGQPDAAVFDAQGRWAWPNGDPAGVAPSAEKETSCS